MASARRSPQYWLAQFPVHGTRGRAMACVAIVVWAVLSRRERNVLMAHPHCPRFILLHVPFVPMPLNRARGHLRPDRSTVDSLLSAQKALNRSAGSP